MISQSLKRFHGIWRLIPARSVYEQGQPPLSGLYTLKQGEEGEDYLSVNIKWKDFLGKDGQVSYKIKVDGKPHAQKYGSVEVMVESTLIGDILSSTAKTLQGTTLSESTRELRGQGQQLAVVMVNHIGGNKSKIEQFYERV